MWGKDENQLPGERIGTDRRSIRRWAARLGIDERSLRNIMQGVGSRVDAVRGRMPQETRDARKTVED